MGFRVISVRKGPFRMSFQEFVKLSVVVNDQSFKICVHRHFEGVLQRMSTTGRAETRWGEYLT